MATMSDRQSKKPAIKAAVMGKVSVEELLSDHIIYRYGEEAE